MKLYTPMYSKNFDNDAKLSLIKNNGFRKYIINSAYIINRQSLAETFETLIETCIFLISWFQYKQSFAMPINYLTFYNFIPHQMMNNTLFLLVMKF